MTEVIFGGEGEFNDGDHCENFLQMLRYATPIGTYTPDDVVVVLDSGSYLLMLVDYDDTQVPVFKFENMCQHPENKTVSFTVKFFETDNFHVVYETSDEWKKPTKEQCEILVKWFPRTGYSVKVPEYNLSADAEPEEEED